jgi:hypothetical protein
LLKARPDPSNAALIFLISIPDINTKNFSGKIPLQKPEKKEVLFGITSMILRMKSMSMI